MYSIIIDIILSSKTLFLTRRLFCCASCMQLGPKDLVERLVQVPLVIERPLLSKHLGLLQAKRIAIDLDHLPSSATRAMSDTLLSRWTRSIVATRTDTVAFQMIL